MRVKESFFSIGNKTENGANGDDVVPTGLQQISSKKFVERISTSFSGLGQSKTHFHYHEQKVIISCSSC